MARGGGLFFSWRLLRCRACVDHGSGHAAPCHHGSGWHEGGWFLFFSWRLLRCRACVDHGSGHAAPCHHGSGWHEGGWFLFFFFGGCSGVGRVLTTGVVMRHRATTGVDGTRGVGFCFFLGGCSGVGRVLTTGVVMRRRATTGVDGTRGVGFCFFLGGCSGVGRVLTTGVVMRRRATTGVDGTRGVGFCFFLGGCSGVGGGFFHRLWRDGTRRFWFGGLFHTLGAWERHRGGGALLLFVLRVVAGAGMRSRASRDAFPSGAWERHRGGGALLPFVLRVVAGACVGRWTGQPRMPPRERQHEGLGGLFHMLWSDATSINALCFKRFARRKRRILRRRRALFRRTTRHPLWRRWPRM